MMEDTTLATMQRSLSEAREAKRKILSRLQELEAEAASLRSQLTFFDIMVEQAEGAMRRMLFPADQAGERPMPPTPSNPQPPPQAPLPDPFGYAQRLNAHLENVSPFQNTGYQPMAYQPNNLQPQGYQPSYQTNGFHAQEFQAPDIEAAVAEARKSEKEGNVRFNDFRIPQAATIVLREANGPLHVSDIYRRMAEGGFEFRGQHQLITLAVSLSRSKRFRKIAPGTFELNPLFQAQAGQVA